jgi:hypothetical protein
MTGLATRERRTESMDAAKVIEIVIVALRIVVALLNR